MVFSDFITIAAITLHNAFTKIDALEEEYLQTIEKYDKDEVRQFGDLLACVIELLQVAPYDILGKLYMSLEISNKHSGQFFTPFNVSLFMATLAYDKDEVKTKSYMTLHDPACGAGGLVLAMAKLLIDDGHNPVNALWCKCVDIDRIAAFMCFIQLTLWNIPAQVVVGNTLTLEEKQVFYTPAHYMGGWTQRFREETAIEQMQELLV